MTAAGEQTSPLENDIIDIVAQVTQYPRDTLHRDMPLRPDRKSQTPCNFDSLHLVEITMKIEERYSIQIPDIALKDMDTLGGFIGLVEHMKGFNNNPEDVAANIILEPGRVKIDTESPGYRVRWD